MHSLNRRPACLLWGRVPVSPIVSPRNPPHWLTWFGFRKNKVFFYCSMQMLTPYQLTILSSPQRRMAWKLVCYLVSYSYVGQLHNDVWLLAKVYSCFLTFDPLSALLNPFVILLTVIARILFLRLAEMSYLERIATGCERGRVQCVSAEIPDRSWNLASYLSVELGEPFDITMNLRHNVKWRSVARRLAALKVDLWQSQLRGFNQYWCR